MNPTDYAKAVAAEVRAEMGRQDKDHVELAGVLGVTAATARTRVRGTQPFDVIELAVVANWLGVDPESLAPRTHPAAEAAS